MKIDAHQHFWIYNPDEYGWMSEDMAVLHRDYLPADLLSALRTIEFDGSIAVQARMSLVETRWLLELAERNPIIKGVVGYVDLCSSDVREQVDEFSNHPKCVGMRHVVHDEPDDHFMLRPEFLHGLSVLADRDLAYDLLLFERHLPVAVQVVQKFPQIRFVLDHIAKPQIKAGSIESWAIGIRELASYDNVTCKLSGMATEADWANWTHEDMMPYLDVTLDAFGANRLMIGSDWPVCLVSKPYDHIMNVVIDYVNELSKDEQDAILGGTCQAAYQLSNEQ
jgi:L-fuconolactonase